MFNLLLFIFIYLIFVYVNIFNLNAVICYYLVYLFDFFGSSLFRFFAGVSKARLISV